MKYADVVLPVPLDALFTYIVPDEKVTQVTPGVRVLVPFGASKQYLGIVVRIHDEKPEGFELKSVLSVMDSSPMVFECQYRLWKWISEYYMCPIGDVMKAAIPAKLKDTKRLRPRHRAEADLLADALSLRPLSEAQQQAFSQILDSFRQKAVTLLHGVTSSGKTEVYIHLIHQMIGEGKQVLYLLPEIALTVQMMNRLREVFGSRLGIYHSKFTDAEREALWRKQLSDEPYDVILGARSAVFLPFTRLGLVVVDEEHETSYKQQEPSPRYHARSVAIVLAQMFKAKTLLGTATPSMESYYNARSGKYGLVELKERFKHIELPQIVVVDTKDLRHRKMMNGIFSPLLLSKVREALERGEQAILFQNRRGFAPMVMCKQCGWVPRCGQCDVSLTLHRSQSLLTCHYCGNTYRIPTECPACGCTQLMTRGYGTEKVEEELKALIPEARVARMDLDTAHTRKAFETLISDFSSGHTDILIGTQMVSKGLDFAHVSVVGILQSDSMLNLPDFRAFEYAYMMMEQVSGRSGRAGRQGQVILQTSNPELPLIHHLVNHDFQSVFTELLEERRAFSYPPFTRLIYIYLRHRHESVVERASQELAAALRVVLSSRVLGPDKPSVARVKTQSIRKIMLKLEPTLDLHRTKAWLHEVLARQFTGKAYASLQVFFDVDPM